MPPRYTKHVTNTTTPPDTSALLTELRQERLWFPGLEDLMLSGASQLLLTEHLPGLPGRGYYPLQLSAVTKAFPPVAELVDPPNVRRSDPRTLRVLVLPTNIIPWITTWADIESSYASVALWDRETVSKLQARTITSNFDFLPGCSGLVHEYARFVIFMYPSF